MAERRSCNRRWALILRPINGLRVSGTRLTALVSQVAIARALGGTRAHGEEGGGLSFVLGRDHGRYRGGMGTERERRDANQCGPEVARKEIVQKRKLDQEMSIGGYAKK